MAVSLKWEVVGSRLTFYKNILQILLILQNSYVGKTRFGLFARNFDILML